MDKLDFLKEENRLRAKAVECKDALRNGDMGKVRQILIDLKDMDEYCWTSLIMEVASKGSIGGTSL